MPRPSKLQMTVGEKAAHTRKWRLASQLAHKKAKNAKTFTKYILFQKGYKCISLDSKKGYEYKGIVDLIAVRRDRKDPDRLNVVLIQVKGGSAKVSRNELKRLRSAVKRVKVSWNTAEKPDKRVRFRRKI